MAQQFPIKIVYKPINKPLELKSTTDATKLPSFKTPIIDEAYKAFFASLFKIKDKEVHRRVLQAINGKSITCAMCASRIPDINKTNNVISPKQEASPNKAKFSFATQTLDKDFEFLQKINAPKTNGTSTSECVVLNKIQLGRAKRKFEPYAVKSEDIKIEPASNSINKLNYLANDLSSDSLLNKIRKPKANIDKPLHSPKIKDFTISEQLLFENLVDESMSPHIFFDLKSNEKPPDVLNDYLFVSTMEEEMRTAGICNDGGLYPIHAAIIQGDLYKLKRQLIVYKYRKWDINIRSEEGKKETPLHYAITSGNKEILNQLLENGGDILATNNESDTGLHYAAELVHDTNILTKLLSRIKIEDLCKLNDRSLTILHVATMHKNCKLVKLILNFIDTKLNIVSIAKDIPFTGTPEYFSQLETVHREYIKTFIQENFKKPTIHPMKAKILNHQDGRSGRTALFLSLLNDDQIISLMLIAHFADTRIPDFGGTTCAIYSTEILKNRILAQAIYNADSMHNAVVFKTLKQVGRPRNIENRKRISLELNEDDDGDIMAKVTKVFS